MHINVTKAISVDWIEEPSASVSRRRQEFHWKRRCWAAGLLSPKPVSEGRDDAAGDCISVEAVERFRPKTSYFSRADNEISRRRRSEKIKLPPAANAGGVEGEEKGKVPDGLASINWMLPPTVSRR